MTKDRFLNKKKPVFSQNKLMTLGTEISIIMNYPDTISADTILGEMISGLAYTGNKAWGGCNSY